MLEKVKKIIEQYGLLQQGDTVLVAVSGGADSVSLLHCLITLRETYGLSLAVVHLNHGLRGSEADADACFVAELAKHWTVPCYLERADIAELAKSEHLSVETCARKVRYALYEKIAAQIGADRIALGHHADDQAETVLMRFLRGTGQKGMRGIPAVRGAFIRPLLLVNRQEIEAYCAFYGLAYRMDSTNLQPIYLRNKIRLDLLPFLEREYNKNMRHNLLRMQKMALEDQAYWAVEAERQLTLALLQEEAAKLTLDWSKLGLLPIALLKRVLALAIERVHDDLLEISFTDLSEISHFFCHSETGKKILHNKVVLEKSYDQLRVAQVLAPRELGTMQMTILPKWPEKRREHAIYLRFNPDEGLIDWRFWQPGDQIRPRGGNGTKKLKKFFNEQRVPRFRRDELPLLAQGKKVLWLTGFGKAAEEETAVFIAEIELGGSVKDERGFTGDTFDRRSVTAES